MMKNIKVLFFVALFNPWISRVEASPMKFKETILAAETQQLSEMDTFSEGSIFSPLTINNNPINNQGAKFLVAQVKRYLSDRKKDLKIDPLDSSFVNPPRTYSPSLTFTFSAFGANWGDLFIGGTVATAGKERSRIDSYGGLGFGLGDAYNLVGSTVSFNMQSLRNFGATNGIDVDFSSDCI
jgi:hypothetical protein